MLLITLEKGSIEFILVCCINNIKAGCYMVEILLNDLMFADDFCVFCPSVRWFQRILDVCQACAESHGIIFNCSKTVCMTFKAKTAKRAVIPLLTLGSGCTKSKICLPLQRFGDCTRYWAFRWQRYADTTAISKSFFPTFECSAKCTF